MCGDAVSPGTEGLSRRSLLAGSAAVVGGALVTRARRASAGARSTVELGGVTVIPRSEWGGDLAPTGPIAAEPGVRYLLVHHSVDPGNDYAASEVAGVLRSFVRFHTSPDKGWPDLAYNFLVDRFGRVWEGRSGSLAGPVVGDATGGNQGFDQLCCFIGDHQVGEPTPDAFSAMGRLLGALARRYGIPLGDGATATFTSRGSNRHPAGAVVTTPTIAGHRDMSSTQCPGDRVVARLPELRLLAAGGPAPRPPVVPPSAAPSTGTTLPAVSSAPAAPVLPATTTPTTARPKPRVVGATSIAPSDTTDTAAGTHRDGPGRVGPATAVAAGAAVAVAAASGTAVARRGRRTAAGRQDNHGQE